MIFVDGDGVDGWPLTCLLHNALTCCFVCVLDGAAVLLLIARQALQMLPAVATSGVSTSQEARQDRRGSPLLVSL